MNVFINEWDFGLFDNNIRNHFINIYINNILIIIKIIITMGCKTSKKEVPSVIKQPQVTDSCLKPP